MKIWHALSKLGTRQKPATAKPRVSCVSGKKQKARPGKGEQLRELARDILTMNKQMRLRKLPYHLQLADRGHGPEVILIDDKTGRPVNQLAYQHVHDLADLPRDD